MAPFPMRDSAVSPYFHGCLAFLHRHFPPQSTPSHPVINLSSISSSLHPGIPPQSPNSASLSGYVWLRQGLSDSHSIWLPQISCFTLSLKCFSSDSDNCPDVWIGPLLQFSHTLRADAVLPTLLPLSPPPMSSFIPLSFAGFYIFYSRSCCPLSVGVLQALLYLRCIPDVSMERDVLHIHLLLYHFVLCK